MMKKVEVWECECNACRHHWRSRQETEPEICPKCKSPYWNKEGHRMRSKGR